MRQTVKSEVYFRVDPTAIAGGLNMGIKEGKDQ